MQCMRADHTSRPMGLCRAAGLVGHRVLGLEKQRRKPIGKRKRTRNRQKFVVQRLYLYKKFVRRKLKHRQILSNGFMFCLNKSNQNATYNFEHGWDLFIALNTFKDELKLFVMMHWTDALIYSSVVPSSATGFPVLHFFLPILLCFVHRHLKGFGQRWYRCTYAHSSSSFFILIIRCLLPYKSCAASRTQSITHTTHTQMGKLTILSHLAHSQMQFQGTICIISAYFPIQRIINQQQ